MRAVLPFALVLVACSASGPTSTNDSPDSSATDSGFAPVDSGHDVATTPDSGVTPKPDAGKPPACSPPTGSTCPTTGGNCKGIGTPCTKGSGKCPSGLSCDLDLDPKGSGVCISYLKCSPGKGDCGTGANCCQTATTQNIPVCLPNPCIPADCKAEP